MDQNGELHIQESGKNSFAQASYWPLNFKKIVTQDFINSHVPICKKCMNNYECFWYKGKR